MSLIGLLGRAGTAFVGGMAEQANVNFAAKRQAEAQEAAARAEAEAERKMMQFEADLEAQAAEAEAERIAAADKETRARFAGNAVREYKAVSGLDTEKMPYIGFDDNGYQVVKFAEVTEKGYTLEQAQAFAAQANPELQNLGYVQIPIMRDDGRGFTLDLKEFDNATQSGTFKTAAEARAYAEEQLQFYEANGFSAIPLFKTGTDGITVDFQKADAAGTESMLFKTPAEAQQFADEQLRWYNSREEYKGKYEATFETTEDGIAVKLQRIDGKGAAGGVGVSKEGFELDVNYLYKVSPKAGTELTKGGYRDFGIISLTGEPIERFGEVQQGYIEGETHLVFRQNGIGESKVQINESFAGFIQEDFTPEIIRQIEQNKDTGPAGRRAHATMVSTFRNFINNFKDANTEVTPDNILERDIAEQHPWLFELAKESPALSSVLKNTPIDPRAPDDAVAAANPVNMPVTVIPGQGNAKPLLPNVELSPFVMDQEDQQGNLVPTLDQAVLTRVYKLESKSGTEAAELLKVIHSAADPSNGEVTRESIKDGYDNLVMMESVLEDQTFVEGGGFRDPDLSTNTQRQIVDALGVYPTYNDRLIALGATLPDLTVKRAGFNVQVSKNSGRRGKYNAVTGGAMEFKIVGEQLENADNMKTSIVNLRDAINEGGEAGVVLEVESLVTGGQYLFDTVIENLAWEDGYGAEGQKIIDGIRSDFEEAKSLSGDERANALVRVYATMLSYQLARMMDPNGRLSDEDRQTVETAIGLKGIKATPKKLLEVAEELEEQVDYIQARNRAYQSGNTRRIMAAHMYNNMTGGGDFRNILSGIMSPITDETETTTGGGGTSGATLSPAFTRALELQNQQTGTTTQQTPNNPPNDTDTAPAPRPEIPSL